MSEVHNGNTNGTPNIANARKRKGFWSSLLGRSPNANENKDEKEPKHNGLMGLLTANARQAATKEATHLAEHETKKLFDEQLDNRDGSQMNANTQNVVSDPDMSTPTQETMVPPGDVLSAPANWARKMVDAARQKVQSLQGLAS